MSSAAIKAEVERGKRMLEDHSRYLQSQYEAWRQSRQMFPSLEGGRQFVSPLGGEAAWPWGRKKE